MQKRLLLYTLSHFSGFWLVPVSRLVQSMIDICQNPKASLSTWPNFERENKRFLVKESTERTNLRHDESYR